MLGMPGICMLISVLVFTACQHDLDNVPRPGDGPHPDVYADSQGPDGSIRDGPVADQPLKDGPLKEVVVADLGHTDLAADLAQKDGPQPDQSAPTGVQVLQGSFGLMGPVAGNTVQLLEGAFEISSTVCNINHCVTGGILP